MATTVYTHTIKYGWTGPGTSSLSGAVTRTGDADDGRIIQVAPTTTDELVHIAFLIANLVSVYMLSTQDITIETNAADHTGGNLITLTAGVPIVYQASAGQTNPFTHDVTAMYITNAGADAAQVDLRFLSDSTP